MCKIQTKVNGYSLLVIWNIAFKYDRLICYVVKYCDILIEVSNSICLDHRLLWLHWHSLALTSKDIIDINIIYNLLCHVDTIDHLTQSICL